MKMAAAVVCVTEMAVMDLWLWLNVEPETLFKTADPLKPEFKRVYLRLAARFLGRDSWWLYSRYNMAWC